MHAIALLCCEEAKENCNRLAAAAAAAKIFFHIKINATQTVDLYLYQHFFPSNFFHHFFSHSLCDLFATTTELCANDANLRSIGRFCIWWCNGKSRGKWEKDSVSLSQSIFKLAGIIVSRSDVSHSGAYIFPLFLVRETEDSFSFAVRRFVVVECIECISSLLFFFRCPYTLPCMGYHLLRIQSHSSMCLVHRNGCCNFSTFFLSVSLCCMCCVSAAASIPRSLPVPAPHGASGRRNTNFTTIFLHLS